MLTGDGILAEHFKYMYCHSVVADILFKLILLLLCGNMVTVYMLSVLVGLSNDHIE